MTTLEIKQERSLPVQGRVDIVELADLAIHFDSIGMRPNSMSQLMNYVVNLAHWALKSSGQLGFEHNDMDSPLESAQSTLRAAGLYSKSMLSRGRQKLQASMTFESLRSQGISPESYTKQQFNLLHHAQSVKPGMATDKTAELINAYNKVMSDAQQGDIKTDDLVNEEYEEAVAEKIRNNSMKAVHELNYGMGQVMRKTKEELDEDGRRIAEKDKKLMEEMGSCMPQSGLIDLND